MADRNFDTLLDRITPYVPGCPTPTILNNIREVAIRSCERSLLWRKDLGEVTLSPTVDEYLYATPANADVHAIITAQINGRTIEPLNIEEVVRRYPTWRSPTDGPAEPVDIARAGTPRVISQIDPKRYVLVPVPSDDQVYRLRLVVALKPARTATAMEDSILADLEDTIFHGVLQYLYVVPDAAWTNLDLAAFHAKQYTYMVNERRVRANLGNQRTALMAQFKPFS